MSSVHETRGVNDLFAWLKLQLWRRRKPTKFKTRSEAYEGRFIIGQKRNEKESGCSGT